MEPYCYRINLPNSTCNNPVCVDVAPKNAILRVAMAISATNHKCVEVKKYDV
jgi:Fe-S-cluster-containing hydrogenase component 2